jgi:hypothetical protein
MCRGELTPEARKAKTEALLQEEGIPYLPWLPCVESEADTMLRSPEEVGIRIACLFCVAGSAFEVGDTVFKDYLRENDLWDHLTPNEAVFLSNNNPDRKSVINFTWRSEALFVLMWAARLVDDLPLPRRETDTGEIVSRFPGVDQSPWPFIGGLRLRAKSEILDVSDLIYRLHWAVRQASLDGEPPPAGLNAGVIREWHHAINWITRYEDQDWDDVGTDT